ncbi:MAG TPA: carboxymuconolactone decarboxylase family protein [Propionibacteriaceae bacterium]
MARIKQLVDKSDLPDSRHAEFNAVVGILHRVPGPFGILMWRPGLAGAVASAGAELRRNAVLSPAERELAILAVSRELDAAYQWASHVPLARRGGLGEDVLDSLRTGADVSHLPAEIRDIVEFVRQLVRENRVSEEVFAALYEARGERWLVELTATIGQYMYIAAINNAFAVDPVEAASTAEVDRLPPRSVNGSRDRSSKGHPAVEPGG